MPFSFLPVPKTATRRRHCACLFLTPAQHQKLYADKVFDFGDWEWHRNAAWRHRLEPRTFTLVALGFVWQLLHVIFVSVAVGLYHEFAVPMGAPKASVQLTQAFGMITFCLSLLLVFRTNSSYARWWEARTLWGSVVNLSRNYARQVMIWAPPQRAHIARLAARWMVVAVHVLRVHLRQDSIGTHGVCAIHVLTRDELDWLARWRSAPQGAAHILSWAAANLGLEGQKEQVLQELVNKFVDNLGGCERILRTPLPTAYTRHTSRFLLVYVTMAPILLWPTTGWATPIVATFIAFLLMGTENIGVQIEEPFKVLPLDGICSVIETSLKDMELQHFGSSSMEHPHRAVDETTCPDKHMTEAQHATSKLQSMLVGQLDMPFTEPFNGSKRHGTSNGVPSSMPMPFAGAAGAAMEAAGSSGNVIGSPQGHVGSMRPSLETVLPGGRTSSGGQHHPGRSLQSRRSITVNAVHFDAPVVIEVRGTEDHAEEDEQETRDDRPLLERQANGSSV